eukprot:5189786-Prorocentrum_lima.AAC.1
MGRSESAAEPKASAAGPVGKGGDRGILFPLASCRAGAAAIGWEGAAGRGVASVCRGTKTTGCRGSPR